MARSSLTSIATTLALLGLLMSRAPAAEAPDDEPWLPPYPSKASARSTPPYKTVQPTRAAGLSASVS